MRFLFLVSVFAIIAPVSVSAEPRHTLAAVSLRKKPGEKEPVVVQVPANTPVTVLKLEGRWLLVKVAGQTGYLTRTTVSEATPPDLDPEVRWSAAHEVDGKLVGDLFVDVAAAKATLRRAPRADSGAVAEVARGEHLTVVDAVSEPAWIHARDAAGHDGWVARAEVDDGIANTVISGGGAADASGAVAADRGEPVGAAPIRPRAIRAGVGLGFRALGMNLTSNAEGGLTNYVLDAEAVAVTVDLEAIQRVGSRWLVGSDLRGAASSSSPGIDYPGPTGPAGKIPFRTYAADAGVRFGTRARRVFDLAARVGVHYDAFLASDIKNAGLLPRERLLGATLGARVDIAPERSSFTISARFDAMVVGSRAQTPGLEDGTSSTAHALWGGLTMRYALGGRFALLGAYDFARATTQWSGMSVRQPSVSSARRVDTAQLIQLGVSTDL